MTLSIVEAMDSAALYGPWFAGDSWFGWRCVLKAAYALPMEDDEIEFFKSVAGGRDPPTQPVRELWLICGRRAGKDSVASLIVAHIASMFADADTLRPGERAVCLLLACDRGQSAIVKNYTAAYFSEIPLLRDALTRETASGFQLNNQVDISIGTNNFRSVRGRPILAAVLDECAYFRDENSASPDIETYRAILPGMATLPGSVLIGISSPYRRSGLLWNKYRDHFGRPGDVLVVQAASATLNPTLDPAIIARALEDDPAAAGAEWLATFRVDIESYISRESVDAVIVSGRLELPHVQNLRYNAFVDPSGGAQDSMTLAIAHREGDIAVLDLVREIRAPFSPDAAVLEFTDTLKAYKISGVMGDRYGGEFCQERFKKSGIRYETSEKSKSGYYQELLPLLNSRRIELLDHKRLVAQLCSLERRTGRGTGRDSIDHPPGLHDDVANAAAGALVNAAGGRKKFRVTEEMLSFSGAQPRAFF